MREPVSIRAVAMIVSEPPSSRFRAAPKIRFGISSARMSIPPDIVRPLLFWWILNALPRRVRESRRRTTSRLVSALRRAYSRTSWASRTCRPRSLSLELAKTSPLIDRRISVTSSGRSSMRRTRRSTSGLCRLMACASCCMSMVFPAFGGETMSARWPLPTGQKSSTIRMAR